LQTGLVINQTTKAYEKYHIRKLNVNDLCKIIRLQNKIYDSLSNKELFHPFKESELASLFYHNENIILGVFNNKEHLIAFRAATAAGKEFDEISKHLDEKYKNKNKLLLNGAFVDEDYRNNRLQVKMTELTINICKKNNISLLFTVIHPDNTASIKSIKSLGFRPIKEIKVYTQKYLRLLFIKEIQP